ncbi:MAG: hypothetical protein OEW87_11895, partial [Flavobacteriaceae bacterium]|nr:hypothetical protein [Flavobacteriaceae bacterium]
AYQHSSQAMRWKKFIQPHKEKFDRNPNPTIKDRKKFDRFKKMYERESDKDELNYLVRRRAAKQIEDLGVYQQLYEDQVKALPLMLYLKNPIPDDLEIAEALKKVLANNKEFQKETEDLKNVKNYNDLLPLMVFSPLVEKLLQRSPEFCSVATHLRKRYETKKSRREFAQDAGLFVVTAGCMLFTRSPFCLGVGAAGTGAMVISSQLREQELIDQLLTNSPDEQWLYDDIDQINQEQLKKKLALLVIPIGGLSSGAVKFIAKKSSILLKSPAFKNYLRRLRWTKGKSFFVKKRLDLRPVTILTKTKDGSYVALKQVHINATTKLKGLLREAPLKHDVFDLNKFIQAPVRLVSRRLSKNKVSYEFTPFRAFGRVIERKLLKVNKRFTIPVSATSAIVVSALAWDEGIDLLANASAEWKSKGQQALVDENLAKLDYSIDRDYRLRDVKYKLEHKVKIIDSSGGEGKYDQDDARREAMQYIRANRLYLEKISELELGGVAINSEKGIYHILNPDLLAQTAPLWAQLMEYKSEEFWTSPQFKRKDNKGLTKEKFRKLILNNHQHIMITNQVATLGAAKLEQSNSLVIKELSKDPFIKKVLSSVASHLLTPERGTYWLQDYLHWQKQFKDWQVLNITSLEDGQEQSLSTTRQKMLTELDYQINLSK